MPEINKRLRILAGPNGSGKTTVLKEIHKHFYTGPFVNADEIEEKLYRQHYIDLGNEYHVPGLTGSFNFFINTSGKSWIDKAAAENSKITIFESGSRLLVKNDPTPYDAALAADYIRHLLLQDGRTYTFETVMSHPSKISFLRQSIDAGFRNYLYFICTVSPDINVQRVIQRFNMGGHMVPEEKIKKRFFESLQLLEQIIPLCYKAYFFDNSSLNANFEIQPVAVIEGDILTLQTDWVPWWVDDYVIKPLYSQ